MPIGMYRFDWGKAARAPVEAGLMDETHIVRVTEPVWTTPTPGQFNRLSRQ